MVNKNYMYPMKLVPVLKYIVWGGSRLYEQYGKGSDENKKIAESWELSIHKNGINIIDNGDFEGHSLKEVFDVSKGRIVSRNYESSKNPDRFPVLVKYIDAEQNLSVQVHPDNAYAAEVENELGKTEMWYILGAAPDSKIIYGLNESFTRDEIRNLINKNKIEECLNYVSVKPGDVYFIPAGLIHAIGKGILVVEVQQNSDTTYRFYDYDRLVDGKKRELHTEKALDVCIKTKTEVPLKINAVKEKENGCTVELLAESEYFTAKKYDASDTSSEITLNASDNSFNYIICINGSADIIFDGTAYKVQKGDSYLIPAGLGKYTISGGCSFIFVNI